jgi:hypothetical protein
MPDQRPPRPTTAPGDSHLVPTGIGGLRGAAGPGASPHRTQSAGGATSLFGELLASRVIRAGVIAGLVGGMMMALFEMVLGAAAKDPTAVPGTHQSFWTAVTAITSVVFGKSWFHGSFEFWSVFFGLMGHMMNSAIAGVVGVGISTRIFGNPPSRIGAIVVGVTMGMALELLTVKLAINHIQDVHTFETAVPAWGWWAGHAIYGMTVGLVGSSLLLHWHRPTRDRPAPVTR